ncbi:hypothetical protein ACVW0Y_004254, partial [Pseudomonas sp. TE3786]
STAAPAGAATAAMLLTLKSIAAEAAPTLIE